MRTHRGGIAVLMGAALTAVAVISAPAAQASVGLYPGMSITNRDISSTCSLGFLATNSAGKRLAVTAGHCSTAIDQVFVSEKGAKIGYVVARWDDNGDTYFGYTLLWLYDTTHTQDAYFAAWAQPRRRHCGAEIRHAHRCDGRQSNCRLLQVRRRATEHIIDIQQRRCVRRGQWSTLVHVQ
ncbi:chymotrypsin family serine protease [Mycobacteroides abscessus]|uniref:hypothetical protein n=1 Tax=Mycobacteroides abscessus TaxID=36809 RepID=UPI0010420628|nr:hypothetical protein [Mycobacteroides abscessus]MDM2592361.1 hypothetical protein [Mycobacteroides abscessus]MDM2603937.1 hypothetical protein [Mycobacteroides abscessus]